MKMKLLARFMGHKGQRAIEIANVIKNNNKNYK